MSCENKCKSESANCVKARALLQQCLSARLQVQPKTDDKEAEFVEIGNYHPFVVFLLLNRPSPDHASVNIAQSLWSKVFSIKP